MNVDELLSEARDSMSVKNVFAMFGRWRLRR